MRIQQEVGGLQIEESESTRFGIWDLGFGIWDLGFEAVIGPGRRRMGLLSRPSSVGEYRTDGTGVPSYGGEVEEVHGFDDQLGVLWLTQDAASHALIEPALDFLGNFFGVFFQNLFGAWRWMQPFPFFAQAVELAGKDGGPIQIEGVEITVRK